MNNHDNIWINLSLIEPSSTIHFSLWRLTGEAKKIPMLASTTNKIVRNETNWISLEVKCVTLFQVTHSMLSLMIGLSKHTSIITWLAYTHGTNLRFQELIGYTGLKYSQRN